MITSFLENTDFFGSPDDAVNRENAKRVLEAYLEELERKIYLAPEGALFHAKREEVQHAATRDFIDESTERIVAEIRGLRDASPLLSVAEGTLEAKAEEAALAKVIDAGRDLILAGQLEAASELLERAAGDSKHQNPSRHLVFRLFTNLGTCVTRLGDAQRGRDLYRTALKAEPDNPDALLNLAAAELALDNPTDAQPLLERARDLSGDEPRVVATTVLVAHALGRNDEIQTIAASEEAADAHVATALARVFLARADYESAERFAELAASADNKGEGSWILGTVLLARTQNELQADPPLAWMLPDTIRDQLQRAEAALSDAIDAAHANHDDELLSRSLLNRSVVLGIQGAMQRALDDTEEGLRHSAYLYEGLANKALILADLDRHTEAIACVEQIPSKERDATTSRVLAMSYYESGDLPAAIATAAESWDHESNEATNLHLAELLMRAHLDLGDVAKAEDIAHELRERWGDDANALWAVGDFEKRRGQLDNALGTLAAACDVAPPHRKAAIRLDIADVHYRRREYGQAASIFTEIVETDRENPFIGRHVVSLFHAGKLREALELSRRVRGTGAAVPVVTEVEAAILEDLGALDRAGELYRELATVEPEKASHWVGALWAFIRRSESEAARDWLARIPRATVASDPDALIALAQARLILNEPGALEDAFEARRLAPNNPNIHLAYVGILLNREEQEQSLLTVSTAAPETVVQLERNTERTTLTLTDQEDARLDHGEVNVDSDLGKQLLGRKRGDRIRLGGGTDEYEIVEIQSKYVAAFQQTLLMFPVWFPSNRDLQRIEVPENDVSQVLALVDARHQLISQAMELYRTRSMPLGTMARLIGRSTIELWQGLVGLQDQQLHAASAQLADRLADMETARSTQALVLDVTAALTIAYLGHQDALRERYSDLFATQATLDMLNEDIAMRYEGATSTSVMAKVGAEYVHHDLTPEQLEHEKAFLVTARDFLTSHAEIVAVDERLALDSGRYEELCDLVGRESIDAALLAKGKALPLYSDDLRLRQLAHSELGVSGTSSDAILEIAHDEGLLSVDDHRDAVKKLIFGNYVFTTVTPDGIAHLLEEANFELTAEVGRVLTAALAPPSDEDDAIGIAADLLKSIWMKPLLEHRQLWLLDVILNITGRSPRNRRVVAAKLARAVASRFYLMPLALEKVVQTIQLWAASA